MREIKFRGKDILHKKWQYGSLAKDEPQKAYYIIDNDYGRGIDVDESTIGQYTGLKDINGKEIYEGDIVAEKGHYVNSDRLVYQKIQWKENYSCWLRGEYQRLTPKNIKTYQIEVVGNIYDNPELLKEA